MGIRSCGAGSKMKKVRFTVEVPDGFKATGYGYPAMTDYFLDFDNGTPVATRTTSEMEDARLGPFILLTEYKALQTKRAKEKGFILRPALAPGTKVCPDCKGAKYCGADLQWYRCGNCNDTGVVKA